MQKVCKNPASYLDSVNYSLLNVVKQYAEILHLNLIQSSVHVVSFAAVFSVVMQRSSLVGEGTLRDEPKQRLRRRLMYMYY